MKAMEVSGIEGSYRSTCEQTMSVLRGSRDSLVAMLEAFVYDPLISWRLVDLSPGGSKDNSSEKLRGPHDLSQSNMTTGICVPSLSQQGLVQHPVNQNLSSEGTGEWPGVSGTPSGKNMGAALPGPSHFSVARRATGVSTSRSRSLQMYNNIQNWASNLDTDNRIASVAADRSEHAVAAEGSVAKSRLERSVRQREMLNLLDGDEGVAHEEALNEKALKVIRRVQDKLKGTDFPDFGETSEPLDVPEQVQRLIVQATSSENLCQLFIGW